ncbi:MAG TPA: hypothetical protein VFI33_08365 [Puia sp.]|nr:hypothetical protein [Puia sp.]
MSHAVSTRVYKYNPHTFVVLGIYSLCFVVFFYLIFWMSVSEMLLFGSILIAIPLYVRYGNNEKVKLRRWDENRLTFSSKGIDFGNAHYPINGMEMTAIFLEAFTGFEHREPGMQRNIYMKAKGDRNRISFRYQGEEIDFTFCLASYADFCTFRAVINDWERAGLEFSLKQVYEDNFIVEEMGRYQAQTGFA